MPRCRSTCSGSYGARTPSGTRCCASERRPMRRFSSPQTRYLPDSHFAYEKSSWAFQKRRPIMVLLRETAIPAFIAALVLSLAGAPPAAATSATGNQNPDLTAEVSLASRGTADPNFATVGDTVDAVLAVRNNKPWSFSARLENVRVRLTLVTPSGGAYDVSATIFLL